MFPNINNMKIYLICGKTDLRKGIDGLAALVTEAFSLDAYDNAIFLFCGTRSNRFKALYWNKTGFVLQAHWKRAFSVAEKSERGQKDKRASIAQTLGRIFRRVKENRSSLWKRAAFLNIDTPALHFYMDLAGVFMYDSAHAYGTKVNEMDEKDKRIKELEQQVAELTELIAFLTSKLFGKKLKKRTVFRKMTDN